jgi:hypothetical protein
MTTAKATFLKTLKDWLTCQTTESDSGNYFHRHMEEQLCSRAEIIEEFKELVSAVHDDARNRLRSIYGIENTLDSLGELPTPGTESFIVDDYPSRLPLDTLKGYFGELFGAVVAENFNPFDEDWVVPALLFRYHDLAFAWLEQLRQGANPSSNLVGRHGNDCLAFQMDEDGRIVRSLVCEAKCTSLHQNKMLNDAHSNTSEAVLVPTSYLQLIEILKQYADTDSRAAEWVDALRQLRAVTSATPTYERCDLVTYVCGLPPAEAETEIIPCQSPHPLYQGGRRLEAVEACLHDVEGLIEQIYDKPNEHPHISVTSIDDETWSSVLPQISPKNVRDLYEQQCWLCHFDGHTAVVGVRSLASFREVQRRRDNLKKAFIKAGLFTPVGKRKKPTIKFKHHFQ